jgi:TolA-binding protein
MRRFFTGAAPLLVVWLCGSTAAHAATIPSAPDSTTAIAIDWGAFNYGRAVDCWTRGDYRTAANYLEQINVTTSSSYAQADRAAFLLAMAYLRLHDARAFERVAARAGSDTGSPWRRWIRYCALIEPSSRSSSATTPAAPAEFAGAGVMEAALLLEGGDATAALSVLDASKPDDSIASVHLYIRALARHSLGQDASADWEALARRKPANTAEADLVGRAAIELATTRLAQPERAATALDLTPTQSRYYTRALQMKALLAIEHGDTAAAGQTLRTLQKDHPHAAGSRDAQLMLGHSMMERRYWYAALRYFEAASNDWEADSLAVARLEHGDGVDAAWSVWQRRDAWNDEIRLAPEALLTSAGAIADASLSATTSTPLPASNDDARSLWPGWSSTDSVVALERYTPAPEESERIRSIERAAESARAELAHQNARFAERTAELERQRRYLDRGARAAQTSADSLDASIIRLNALIARLDAALAELTHVRDGALAHVAARTRDMTTQLEDEIVFMRALRHFHVDGPQRDRPERFPEGVPSTADVLAHEEALAAQAEQFLGFFAAHYSGVIRLSFDRAWRPHLAENSKRLKGELATEMARARGIDASIDSTRAALAHDPELASIATRSNALVATVDSLDVAEVTTRKGDRDRGGEARPGHAGGRARRHRLPHGRCEL